MNPYREDILLTGMAQAGGRFIGLRDELELLVARISDERPAAVSLVGPRGLGKSFLLRYLDEAHGPQPAYAAAIGPRFADDPERLLFVRLDFGDAALTGRAPDLMPLLFDRLLRSLARLLRIEDARLLPLDRMRTTRARSIAALRAEAARALAEARAAATDDELRDVFTARFGRQPDALLQLLRTLESWGLRVVFLLDDFDSIAGHLTHSEYDHLRALLSAASLVIASTRALSEQVPAEVQSSPFFNLLERLNLVSIHFLVDEEARRLVTEPPGWFEATAGFRFSESDTDFILSLTGLHPDLISATCEFLYRTRRAPLGLDVVPPAERPLVRALLRDRFADFFALLWHPLTPVERRVLTAIAAGKLRDPGDIPPSLVSRGYVVYREGRYRLFAGLFEDFVREQAMLDEARAAAVPAPRGGLTDLEERLYNVLRARPGAIVGRDEIIAALYDPRADPSKARGKLDTLVSRLRAKLKDEPVRIESVRGQGYRLVVLSSEF